jgi:alpha-L-rhamnosidase
LNSYLNSMKPNALLIALTGLFSITFSYSQDFYKQQRAGWLKVAEATKPALVKRIITPVTLVKLVKDETAFQGWRTETAGPVDSLYRSSFKKNSGVVVDFGAHQTGYFTFSIKALNSVSDAPLRFKLTFGEVPSELATPFDPYTGTLSRAWLQDEIITVSELPATVTLARRVSFRYLKIELLGSSRYFDFAVTGMQFSAETSVKTTPVSLAPGTDQMISKIDATGLATLKECMQTVYEDGPKRDRRLWIGDLYLESLANTYSFKNHDLTKRCLYLLAALARQDGYLNSNVFETPEPHPQLGSPFLFDYSLLYNVTLKEYLSATGDKKTALDLWPVVKKQLDNPKKYLLDNGLFDNEAAVKNRWWLFVDWNDQLDRQASIQGIIIFALKNTWELAKTLGKENEVSELPALIEKMSNGARKHLYDAGSGMFTSGPRRQLSYASQAWMVLSGVASEEEARTALRTVASIGNAVKPGAPYLFHYYVEALIGCGLKAEAKQALLGYWGGMVKKDADTFWEVYDPSNEYLSPYNFFPVNSYCHAWSCTPVYFVRKYPSIFQN